MAKTLQIFKGGFDNSHENRIAINQRPADGHLKSATWEERVRFNRYSFPCGSPPRLEVGDVIELHTTLTFGIIEGLGISVITPEKGLKLKLVVSDSNELDIGGVIANGLEYDQSQEKFAIVDSISTTADLDEIGDTQRYYAIYGNSSSTIASINPVAIGFEVISLPPEGLNWTFDIETRLHSRQLIRPPVSMNGCC